MNPWCSIPLSQKTGPLSVSCNRAYRYHTAVAAFCLGVLLLWFVQFYPKMCYDYELSSVFGPEFRTSHGYQVFTILNLTSLPGSYHTSYRFWWFHGIRFFGGPCRRPIMYPGSVGSVWKTQIRVRSDPGRKTVPASASSLPVTAVAKSCSRGPFLASDGV